MTRYVQRRKSDGKYIGNRSDWTPFFDYAYVFVPDCNRDLYSDAEWIPVEVTVVGQSDETAVSSPRPAVSPRPSVGEEWFAKIGPAIKRVRIGAVWSKVAAVQASGGDVVYFEIGGPELLEKVTER